MTSPKKHAEAFDIPLREDSVSVTAASPPARLLQRLDDAKSPYPPHHVIMD